MDTLITITIILIIIGSILALELNDLLSAVIALGVAGYGISVIFLLAVAPDLAITQIVVEILALVILIRAMVVRETTVAPPRMSGMRLAALVITAVFAIGSFLYFSSMALVSGGGMPDFGSPLMKVSSFYIRDSLQKVGASNIVSAIILDFRAIDTLGEATVLFAAAIGVIAILRKETLSSRTGNSDDKTDGRE